MNSQSRKLDLSTLAGFAVALTGILGGLLLEGGKLSDVAQITAGMIVLGGTIGAVMVTTPIGLLLSAVKMLPQLFWETETSADSVIEVILELAAKARKNGIVSLERSLEQVSDPFLRKALSLAVDGTDLQGLRQIMELEIHVSELRGESQAKVFEAAGGYAPTVGIIGAVLGLIQVMKHLEDIEAVGHGIAVAFVATVYGVAAANIVFLPAATKLKLRLQQKLQIYEMMLEGALNIADGLNPKLIRSKLEAFQQKASDAAATQRSPNSSSQTRPLTAQ